MGQSGKEIQAFASTTRTEMFSLAACSQQINREARLLSETYCVIGQTVAVGVVNA